MPGQYQNQLNQSPAAHQQMLRQQALQAFYAHRAQALQQPQGYTAGQAAQDFQGAMLLHPAWMLDWVNNKIKSATGQQ